MKVAIAGAGYVGFSNAVLLAQKNKVVIKEIDPGKVDLINKGMSPINDEHVTEFLRNAVNNLRATLDPQEAYTGARFVVIATPTDYNSITNYFDTSAVEDVIKEVFHINPRAVVVIRSTVPIGYTEELRSRFDGLEIIFVPEFLREGKAVYDSFFPSRIIVGGYSEHAREFANMLVDGARKEDVPVLFTNPTEAESIKLFSNTYLAMRVAFFNELDTFAESHGLNTRDIIEGVCLDPRIGMHYNNPSFGYGGYCLPKDTKQLLANYVERGIPHYMIKATIESNIARKFFIAHQILDRNPCVVGVYRLTMKSGSDNFRESAVIDIIEYLRAKGVEVIVYEPLISDRSFMGFEVVRCLNELFDRSDLIIANRYRSELESVRHKVYTRDLFGEN